MRATSKETRMFPPTQLDGATGTTTIANPLICFTGCDG